MGRSSLAPFIGKSISQLRLEVGADLDKRNEQRTKPYFYEFSIVGSKPPSNFIAMISGDRVSQKVVEFKLTTSGVAVHKNGSVEPSFEASTTLNNDGECRPKSDGEEYDSWQVRRMALEEPLFESVENGQ